MVGTKVVVFVMTVVTSYATVHFYHAKIYMYLCYCVIFVSCVILQAIVYPSASAVFKVSNPVHSIFLPRTPKYSYLRRCLKSCAPLKVWVGPFYFFRPFTPMKFFKIELAYAMKAHFYLRK